MQERFEQAPIQVGHLTTTLQQQVGESVDDQVFTCLFVALPSLLL